MKKKGTMTLLLIGAGLLLFEWYKKQQGNGLAVIPINPPPAQQNAIDSLFPTVDANGNISYPTGGGDTTEVTSRITGWEPIDQGIAALPLAG